jgi:hypothetical protein
MKINRDFDGEMTKAITGKEFRETGALWFVNQTLHLFGMAITWDQDTDELKAAIVRFRGFSEKVNDSGYERLSQYISDNIAELIKECE